MNKWISILLIFLSWPICLVNRAIIDNPQKKVNWIVFKPEIRQSIAWYWTDTGIILSSLFFIFGTWLMLQVIAKFIEKPKMLFFIKITYILVSALLIVNCIDLVHYWLWFKQNEYVAWAEGLIMLIAAIKISNKCKQNFP